MAGVEIYIKKEKFAWDIACLDFCVVIIALSAIFTALFAIFAIPYRMSNVYFLLGIASVMAILVIWGKKWKPIRLGILLLVGVGSYFYLHYNPLFPYRLTMIYYNKY